MQLASSGRDLRVAGDTGSRSLQPVGVAATVWGGLSGVDVGAHGQAERVGAAVSGVPLGSVPVHSPRLPTGEMHMNRCDIRVLLDGSAYVTALEHSCVFKT